MLVHRRGGRCIIFAVDGPRYVTILTAVFPESDKNDFEVLTWWHQAHPCTVT